MGNADYSDFLAELAEFTNKDNIDEFVRRCRVCPNSRKKVLELANGNDEVWDEHDGQEH